MSQFKKIIEETEDDAPELNQQLLWQRLEQRLDEKPKKRRKAAFWWFAAASCVLALWAYQWNFMQKNTENLPLVQQTNVLPQKSVEIKQATEQLAIRKPKAKKVQNEIKEIEVQQEKIAIVEIKAKDLQIKSVPLGFDSTIIKLDRVAETKSKLRQIPLSEYITIPEEKSIRYKKSIITFGQENVEIPKTIGLSFTVK